MNALRISGLAKRYRSIAAVSGVSFEVSEREIFALVGPNGAGKSTTLKMVATILKPSAGSIELFGIDTLREPHRAREVLSYLPEEAGAYKNLTGREYLRFMAEVFFEDSSAQNKALDYAAELAGLKDRLKDKVKTYSKGMTRKLLLARALMTKPKLAILDEPTSGLDILNSFEIRRMLKGLAAEGMTVLLSSHNMLEIEFLADRVAIVDKGVILDTGPVADIKKRHGATNLEEAFAKIVS